MPNSPPSPPRSPSHSTEVEHRLTVGEQERSHIRYRLSLHEKVMLALAGGIYVLFQDRFPQIAEVIRKAWPQ